MKKLRGILLGVALALPLAATGASGDVSAEGVRSTMTQVQSVPQGQNKCCWIFHLGMYWCIPC